MKKFLTSKKMLPCVLIEGMYVVLSSDGQHVVYDHTNVRDLPEGQDFDAAPFVAFYEAWKLKKAWEAEQKAETERLQEEARIADVERRIRDCADPRDFAQMFGLTRVETAGHWSDLYEGRSSYAVLLSGRIEYDIMQRAIDILGIEGEYGDAAHRAGEHHHTFTRGSDTLEGYQHDLIRHFGGDGYFYRSQESDAEMFLETIRKAESMEDVAAEVEKWQALEDGYYDCNGNLEISETDLNDPDISGYEHDVYSYSFAFQFRYKNRFVEETGEEDNED